MSIVVIVSILSIIGLIVLNSISQDEYSGFFSAPFNKQLFFLIPSILLAFISFLFSVTLWFSGMREEGLFVGIWVPSILSLANFFNSTK